VFFRGAVLTGTHGFFKAIDAVAVDMAHQAVSNGGRSRLCDCIVLAISMRFVISPTGFLVEEYLVSARLSPSHSHHAPSPI
jgi:hypothetical protein